MNRPGVSGSIRTYAQERSGIRWERWSRQSRKSPQQDRSHKPRHEANGGAQCGKSACCVRRGGGWKRGTVEVSRTESARQPSTLPMSGMWKRSHGGTIEAPPDERGGNRYVLPNATAPHLDSTNRYRSFAAEPDAKSALARRQTLIQMPNPVAHASRPS